MKPFGERAQEKLKQRPIRRELHMLNMKAFEIGSATTAMPCARARSNRASMNFSSVHGQSGIVCGTFRPNITYSLYSSGVSRLARWGRT